jgi:hypothetical protein
MGFTPPCPMCNQLKVWVADRWECHSSECEKLREGARRDRENGVQTIYFAPVVGGGGPLSARRAHEQKFNRDMDAYREARRVGEQPETTTVEGVEKARRKQETRERALANEAVVEATGDILGTN